MSHEPHFQAQKKDPEGFQNHFQILFRLKILFCFHLVQKFPGQVPAVGFRQAEPHQPGDGGPDIPHLHGRDFDPFADPAAKGRKQAEIRRPSGASAVCGA